MASNGGEQQWAWLGLLKWSLSYTDGTKPSDMTAMSEEDKKFLEEVMRDGILDENERMKVILETMATAMEAFQNANGSSELSTNTNELEDLLSELRDIVEQIDYARAFCSLKGLPFLLGCIQQRQAVPESIRIACLGVLATLCQNNPPVQLQLLELGSIKILSDLFFVDQPKAKAKIVQAMSANVRNHEVAEQIFCQTEQATEIFAQGLMATETPQLQQKTLFFLRALVTADSADRSRVRQFQSSIGYIADTFLQETNGFEVRELSLQLLNSILEQKKSVNAILAHKNAVAALGVQRVSVMRALSGEEREYAAVELEEWEKLLQQLARAEPDQEERPLMIAEGEALPTALPQ